MIELRKITEDNLEECIALEVRAEQRSFVAPNVLSLAEAYVDREMYPWALYASGEEERMVGFAMLGFDRKTGRYWIVRLMIDRRYQGKGLGRQAMERLLDILAAEGARAAYLSFEPENAGARRLYESLGFAATGEIEDGEIVMKKQL